LDNKYLEEQSISNKEVDENSMDSVVVNDDIDSDFSIRSNIDNDDDDNITTNEKGKACNKHRQFKKGLCKFCLVCRYCIPLEMCDKNIITSVGQRSILTRKDWKT